LRVPAPKEGPPYKIGDIIGYSEEGLEELYVGKVAVAAKWGNIYVADKDWNLTLEKKEKESKEIGYVIKARGTQWEYRIGPNDIAIDSKGCLYLNDVVDKEVHKYSPQGTYLQTIKYEFTCFRPMITIDLATDELYIYIIMMI
jgi:sugar lactone lactonase YvrE